MTDGPSPPVPCPPAGSTVPGEQATSSSAEPLLSQRSFGTTSTSSSTASSERHGWSSDDSLSEEDQREQDTDDSFDDQSAVATDPYGYSPAVHDDDSGGMPSDAGTDVRSRGCSSGRSDCPTSRLLFYITSL